MIRSSRVEAWGIAVHEQNEEYWSLMFSNRLRWVSNYLQDFLEDKWVFKRPEKGECSGSIQQVEKSRKLQARQHNFNSQKNLETNHETIHLQGKTGSNSAATWRQPAISLTEQKSLICEIEATDVLYLHFHQALLPVSYNTLIRKSGK